MYHEINEAAAKRAHTANSFREFKPGSATASYRAQVDEAARIAEAQKERVDSIHHERIDGLLASYSKKLAEHINRGFEIDARVPSMMVAGGSNFPTAKKEKQNAARDRHMRDYDEVKGLLDKIRSAGMGGISSDDPQAIDKLKVKLADLEESQNLMKRVNAYYRKHKTFEGCPDISAENAAKIEANWASGWYKGIPFPPYSLQNNNANIKRVKERIALLEKQAERAAAAAALPEGQEDGWAFDGGRVLRNYPENRLQLLFEDKPEQDLRTEMKRYGFRWSPRNSAWQRVLSSAAEYDAHTILQRFNLEPSNE